jgi:transcriptional regulator of met regulon
MDCGTSERVKGKGEHHRHPIRGVNYIERTIKFMTENQFREIGKTYANYKAFQRKLDNQFKQTVNEGYTSPKGLQVIKRENTQKLQQERQRVTARLDKIRSELISDLDYDYGKFERSCEVGYTRFNILKTYVDNFKLSAKEWEKVATDHRDNLFLSRYIHDKALDNGYTLNNYVSYEDCISEIDGLIDRVKADLDVTDPLLSRYIGKDDNCMADCGYVYGKLTNHEDIQCLPIANTLEQAILNENAKRNATTSAEQDRAFVEAFTGKPQPQPKAEDILTSQEMEVAKQLALANGRQDITPEDVDKVRLATKLDENVEDIEPHTN